MYLNHILALYALVGVICTVHSIAGPRPVSLNQDSLPAADGPGPSTSLVSQPLYFEVHRRPAELEVEFLARARGYSVLLSSDGVTLNLNHQRAFTNEAAPPARTARSIRLQFVGAHPGSPLKGMGLLPGRINYLIGKDPSDWRTNVATFAKVKYENVYPGVDAVFYGNEHELEFDFVVAPGADPGVIAFTLEGADHVELDGRGNLGAGLEGREVTFRAPFVYQEQNGHRREIAGRYVERPRLPQDFVTDDASRLNRSESKSGLTSAATFGFELAAYDPAKPLVIDPVISFSTYLGGRGYDGAQACAVDAFGNVYVFSYAAGEEMPLNHPLSPFRGSVHIAKFDPTGSELIFGTYFGVNRSHGNAHDIKVDAAGNIYVVGRLGVNGPFPYVTDLYGRASASDAFVLKLNASGSQIIYSALIGGSRDDFASSVATDREGNAYVVGHTLSADFPTTTNSFQPQFGGNGDEGDPNNLQGDVFILKISPDGSELLFSSFLGGSLADQARAVAVDADGNAFVTGFTESTDFPLMNPLQTEMRGADASHVLQKRGDAFVTKVNAAGTSLLFSTYLGGSGPDYGIDVATDLTGDVYISGYTCCASDFPFRNGFERPDAGARGFVTKLRGDGSQLVYSTALWGSFDYETHIAVDALGAVYAVGNSLHDIRVANPIQATRGGGSDVFVTRIVPDGSSFDFSTWLGGTGEEVASDIAVDSAGHVFVAGATASTNFPTLNPFQSANGGDLDGFLARLDFEDVPPAPPPSTQHFTATLLGVSAEPLNASTAKGVGRFVLEGAQLTYTVSYTGLTSPPLGAHLHRADLADDPGTVVRGHAGASLSAGAGQLSGVVYLDSVALSELANGLFNFDLHTAAFPNGEIRGRVIPGTNEPPGISFVADQNISINGSAQFAFTVNDTESATGDLTIRARSSNDRLLPNNQLILSGTGASRSLTATPLPGEIGVTTITLEVRDAAGASATTSFKLRVWRPDENYDAGIGSLTVSSPASNAVLSGTVAWTASARRTSRPEELAAMQARGCSEEAITNGICGVEDLTFFVDGAWLSQIGGGDATVQLDTTQLANGTHELTVRARAWPDTSIWIGVDQRFVTVDNGRIPLELRAGWNEIILAPGQTERMAPRWVFTNGDEEDAIGSATFSSADTNVATVDATGVVSGVAPGVTTVTTTALGLTATTRVIVDVPVGFPHFGKDGAVLYQYEPGRSLFVRTLFVTAPQELEQTAGLAEASKQAGINVLTTGFYNNPVWSQPPDLESHMRGWEQHTWSRIEAVLLAYDFSLLFTGDDILRTRFEFDNTLNNSWSKDYLALALSRARDTKRVIGIEMVDEISFVWGDTPTPSDGRWLTANPPIPDDAFIRLMAMMNSVSNRPAITWPIGGVSPPQVAANWMGNPAFADYATHYWDTWNHPYYFGGSPLPHIKQQMGDAAMYGRLSAIQRNKPQFALLGTTGPFYMKLGPGNHFSIGQDKLHDGEGGHRPKAVMAEIMFAAVAGMSGVRGYSYDWQIWKDQRANAPIGQGDLQTGTDPFTVGTERWDAMSTSFNFIAEIEPYLLQPKISAVDLGTSIATGARSGANGKVLMALNLSEVPQRIKANLQPYSASSEIIRYRLTLNGAIKETLTARALDDFVIESGETVVWIFNRPMITWLPADIASGTPLGAPQINATTSVPGDLEYSPPAGTNLPAGVWTLSVTFTPSDTNNYLPVTTSATINVVKLGQTLTFPTLADRTTADSPFDLVASVTSGLPVSFQVLSGPATIAGNTVTLTSSGVVTLRALQSGNEIFDSAIVDRSFNVVIVNPPLMIKEISVSNNMLTLTWSAIPGQRYRLQSTENLNVPDWTDVPGEIVADGATASNAITIGTQAQGFFRIIQAP